eukprot:365222-Chlamydomonas_euryale.AAC.13
MTSTKTFAPSAGTVAGLMTSTEAFVPSAGTWSMRGGVFGGGLSEWAQPLSLSTRMLHTCKRQEDATWGSFCLSQQDS